MPDLNDSRDVSRDVVKVFGERNTGTNAFAELIRNNSQSRVLPTQMRELPGLSPLIGRALSRFAPKSMREPLTDWVFSQAATCDAWKHKATRFSEAELAQFARHPVFIMIRHPASWLFGLRRRPYHALQQVPADLSEFLKTDWKTVSRDGLDRKSFRPAALYNEKMRSYLWFENALQDLGGVVQFVRFEDFVIDQVSVFHSAAHHLENPSANPQIVSKSTKKSSKSAADYAAYYQDQVWAQSIDANSGAIIKSEIDWSNVSRFYGPQDWAGMDPK